MRGRAFLIVAAAAALWGCAARGERVFGPADGSGRTIVVEVDNLSFDEATVLVFRANQRSRAGRVGGKGREKFRLQWPGPGPLRVEFRLLSGPTCFSEELIVDPGDEVLLQIPLEPRGDPNCRDGR